MYKDYELTVNAGVTSASPTEFIRTFPPSVIDMLTVSFPRGPNREVYVRVLHEAENVFPQDPPQWINGEDEEVVIIGPWQNWDMVYRLRLQMCSPGARLPHKVIFRFNLSEIDVLSPVRNAFDQLRTRFLSFP